MASESRQAVLFLCTGNSCRSQMAEGWAKSMHADKFDVYSAGIEAHGQNPNAIRVMQEAGVDITGQQSQRLEELGDTKLDVVITVCGHADENCPVLPVECQKMHVPFDDPPRLAKAASTEEEGLDCYRRVRDEIRDFVTTLPEKLAQPS